MLTFLNSVCDGVNWTLFSKQSQDEDIKQPENAEQTDQQATATEQQEPEKSEVKTVLAEDSGRVDAAKKPAEESHVTAPTIETSHPEAKEETGERPEEEREVEAGDQEQDESRMHVLGHDDNIRTKSLEELPADQVSWSYDIVDHLPPPVDRNFEMVSSLDTSLDEFTIQLKLSTTATLGQKKLAIVERFKQESMYGLSAEKVAVVERWPLVEVWLYYC